jgi:hypothetical protein
MINNSNIMERIKKEEQRLKEITEKLEKEKEALRPLIIPRLLSNKDKLKTLLEEKINLERQIQADEDFLYMELCSICNVRVPKRLIWVCSPVIGPPHNLCDKHDMTPCNYKDALYACKKDSCSKHKRDHYNCDPYTDF